MKTQPIDHADQYAATNYTAGYIAGKGDASDTVDLAEQRRWFEQFNPTDDDDAAQAADLRRWWASHPEAKPLPRVLVWCLLIALGCGLTFFLSGIVLGSWALTAFGAALVALMLAYAWKAGA